MGQTVQNCMQRGTYQMLGETGISETGETK